MLIVHVHVRVKPAGVEKAARASSMKGIVSGRRGRPQGSCRTLTAEQEEQIQRLICDKQPEQLKLDFALWTRAAVMLLIEREFSIRRLCAV